MTPARSVPDFTITDVCTAGASVPEAPGWVARHMGLDRVAYTGKAQRVGVLDTGCDVNHIDLKGRVTPANFISGNTERPAYRDTNGHGTFVTGQIVAAENARGVIGVAPDATAFHARVLYGGKKDRQRRDIDADIASAVRECIRQGCHVISMSLGGPGGSAALRDATITAADAGLIVVAAAGNARLSGATQILYPARYASVIAVASADKLDMPAWFSSFAAGGHTHTQPEIAIASLEYYWGCLPGREAYGRMIGTSMATPVAAGVALRWRQMREERGDLPTGSRVTREFRAWLKQVANDTNANGVDPELGYGVLLLEAGEL